MLPLAVNRWGCSGIGSGAASSNSTDWHFYFFRQHENTEVLYFILDALFIFGLILIHVKALPMTFVGLSVFPSPRRAILGPGSAAPEQQHGTLNAKTKVLVNSGSCLAHNQAVLAEWPPGNLQTSSLD